MLLDFQHFFKFNILNLLDDQAYHTKIVLNRPVVDSKSLFGINHTRQDSMQMAG